MKGLVRKASEICFKLHNNPNFRKLANGISIISKLFMKAVAPIFILTCTILVLYIILLYVLIVRHLHTNMLLNIWNTIFAITMSYSIYFNYYMCVITAPGSPPPCSDPSRYLGQAISLPFVSSNNNNNSNTNNSNNNSISNSSENINNNSNSNNNSRNISSGQGPRYRLEVGPALVYSFCRRCRCIKPPRTHHCR